MTSITKYLLKYLLMLIIVITLGVWLLQLPLPITELVFTVKPLSLKDVDKILKLEKNRRLILLADKIYRRYNCNNLNLAALTEKYSDKNNIPANILAAVIVTESYCNPGSISDRGAMGLLQVMPLWLKIYPACHIFDPDENMEIGTQILANYIKQYGLSKGLAYYSNDFTGNYSTKVLELAGYKKHLTNQIKYDKIRPK